MEQNILGCVESRWWMGHRPSAKIDDKEGKTEEWPLDQDPLSIFCLGSPGIT